MNLLGRIVISKSLLILLASFSILGVLAKAEGTRELQPEATYNPRLRLSYSLPVTSDEGGPFATPVAPPEYRLWVTIGNATEIVYFGFKPESNNVFFVIKDSVGTVVYPASGTPMPLPTSGNGYIVDYNQAVNGPKPLNPAGYEPLTFTPPYAGNFYFEFSWNSASGQRYITYWDITVVAPGNIEKRGRVWSKNWQLQMGNNNHPFTGVMYPYTNDQITTSIHFNGMAPARFTVACNPTGVSNTGNFIIDRKSVAGNYTYPEYKIFVNDPDSNLFPTGILGGVDSVKTSNHCDGHLNITLFVNKPGVADIILQINPEPGVQPEDINLSDSVYSGDSTTIVWNGLNGLGDSVPSGTTIGIEITYVNGLTHLPLYDVEYSASTWKGFIVDLIRPQGNKPKVFWDDSNLGGSVNLSGCIDPSGCHSWGYALGDENTINTWWFAVSTSLIPIELLYKRSEQYEHVHTICDGDSILIAGTYYKIAGIYYDSSMNTLGCDSVHVHHLAVNPSPVVDLGPDVVICQGESHTFDAGFNPDYTYLWNTGETSHQITVSTTGYYSVSVTNREQCTRADEVYLYVSPLPGPLQIKHN